jgi:hypothetical protein
MFEGKFIGRALKLCIHLVVTSPNLLVLRASIQFGTYNGGMIHLHVTTGAKPCIMQSEMFLAITMRDATPTRVLCLLFSIGSVVVT